MLRRFLGFIRGDKYLSPDAAEFEVAMTDGTKKIVRVGEVLTTRTGKKYTINNQGGKVLLYDPDFKLKKIDDADLPEDVKDSLKNEVEWATAGAALVLTLLAGGIVALIVLAVL